MDTEYVLKRRCKKLKFEDSQKLSLVCLYSDQNGSNNLNISFYTVSDCFKPKTSKIYEFSKESVKLGCLLLIFKGFLVLMSTKSWVKA